MSHPTTDQLSQLYVVPTYGRFNLNLARGQGSTVWDESGKSYLDFGAGIAVSSVGHCHPKVIESMRTQLGVLIHTSNLYYTLPQAQLAERLVRLTGAPGKIFFCNSGAEANEALYKLARKFGNQCSQTLPPQLDAIPNPSGSPSTIITMDGSFHGRTLAGIAATGQEKVKKGFEPAVPGFTHIPLNDSDALRLAVQSPSVIAILLEPIQGERGVHPATPAFLKLARQLCNQHGLLLFFDEVQCGLGRTGDWCAWKSILGDDSLYPDAVSWAKGIAGGFPLGAVWISNRPVQLNDGSTIPLCDLLGPGSHGTTYGGTPLMSTIAVLTAIEEEGMLENAQTLGSYALHSLQALQSPLIADLRGLGLLIAIELVNDFSTRSPVLSADKAPSLALVEALHSAGLLTVPSGTHAVRLLPPLNVSKEEVDQAIEIIRTTLQSFLS